MAPSPIAVTLVGPDDERAARLARAIRGSDLRVRVTTATAGTWTRLPALAGAAQCALVDLTERSPSAWALMAEVLAGGPDVPILGIVDCDDDLAGLRALRDGAQDCVTVDDLGSPRLARAIRYATLRHETQREQFERALLDPVTGLPNRALFADRLACALARARRSRGVVAVMFIDLDGFKAINDEYGHAVGDLLLERFAKRLRTLLRPGDTVARYGGDEFVVLCEDARSPDDVLAVARRVVRHARPSLFAGPDELMLAASVGVAFSGRATRTAPELIGEADAAMYEAKRRGQGLAVRGTGMGDPRDLARPHA